MKAVHGQFLLAIAAAVLVWWKPLRALVRLALNQDDYSYVLLVIAVSAALLLLERWQPSAPSVKTLAPAVIGIFALSVGIWLNRGVDPSGPGAYLSLSMLLLVVFLLSAFLYVYGRGVFKQM